MRIDRGIWFLAAILCTAAASDGRPLLDAEPFPLLIGFNDLHGVAPFYGGDGSTQLLDVRPRAEYDAGHVEGSIWADLKRAEEIARQPGGLTDRDAWLDWITPLGLYPQSDVRLIGNNRQLDAARTWWLLKYLGVERVGLVNGDFAFWKAQRRPITTEVLPVRPHAFPVDFQPDRLATREDVLASIKLKDAWIIDARSAGEWEGKDLRAKRGGHIPQACRIEWSEFVDKDGRFLALNKLADKIEAAGVLLDRRVITHCQSGGRASVDAFVFELMGYPTRNFYLGWSDWGNADNTPIITAEAAVPATPEPLTTPTAEPIPAPAEKPIEAKPFTVEYHYKCKWGQADEFLSLFTRNHLPILRERMKAGDILSIAMTKPRIHTGEANRWDYRVTLVFKDAAEAFHIAADEPIKQRLFPDQAAYKVEEQRRFMILESHTDLPVEAIDLDKSVTAP